MRALYLLLFLVACNLLSAQAITDKKTLSVYFATASSELSTDARQAITDFRKQLSAYADYDLRLEAFTDERGDTDYNEKLAESRAASVRDLVAKDGMTTSGWEIVTWGERRARRGINDEDELRGDRRVDLVATVRPWTDMEEVLTTLRKDQVQVFTADPTEDVTVRGDRGGRFLIPAGSLVDADGKPATGPVTVSLTEAYTFDDILIAGLTTHSGDRLLETGGMFNLTATDENGNPLSLADGKSIPASIPTDDFNPEMRIFAGVEHAEGEGPNWELTPGRVMNNVQSIPGTNDNAPILVQMEPSLGNLMAEWVELNPHPGDWRSKFVPSKTKRPVFPDTASMFAEVRGLDKLLISKEKLARKTRDKRRAAAADYSIKLYVWERREKQRLEIIAANLEGRKTKGKKLKEWQDKFNAYKQSLLDENGELNDKLRARHKERMKTWWAERELKLEAALTDKNAEGTSDDLQRYFFTVSRLGWANCDTFWGEDDPIEVLANVKGSNEKASVVLLPEKRRAVLSYRHHEGGKWGCKGIPNGWSYELIAYQINDGKIEYAQRRVDAADKYQVNLEFEPVSVEELKTKLKNVKAAK